MNAREQYEADVAAQPNYQDGSPRRTWDQLGEVEKWSWGRPSGSCRDLDREAVSFMSRRPDLRQMSLDEWLIEHHDRLSETERREGQALLQFFDERDTQ